MKKILIIIFVTFSIFESIAQCDGYGILDTIPQLKSAMTYTPTGYIKTIRLIFHFVLKDDGTGNFNELNDGLIPSNEFNGYEYVNYIVNYMNTHLSNNCEMRIQPFGAIPVYDPGYRLESVGVFFWRSTANYSADLNTLVSNYSKNPDDCINVFLVNGGKNYTYFGYNSVRIGNHYSNYIDAINNNNMWYNSFTQKTINHEILHCLNLHHTLMSPGGTCVNNYDDYCYDTPTIQDLLDLGEPNPCCWNSPYCSNNIMDYNASNCAITPDQLGRVHYALDNYKYYSWINHFKTSELNVQTINLSNVYIAETIKFAEIHPSIIEDGRTVFVNASEVFLYPGFEVKKGGMLIVKTNISE